ncbi:MAG: heme exporter protein CcmB [Sediminibacterium sp.]|nr:heme exporter protein CcmB [Sediminibacterium sp.]
MLLSLIKKEFLLEFRQKTTLGGILVYIIGTVFVSALCFKGKVDKPTWNALFWVILLFSSITISGKSFLKEQSGQALFNYLYYRPHQFILSKMIYNMGFMLVLSFITLFFYSWFVSNQIENMGLFVTVLSLASTGFAGVLSLMSAVAAKAQGNFALMSILSFPVLMPLLVLVIRVSKQAVDGLAWSVSYQFLGILMALNVIMIMLAILLFPYLWQD